MIFQDNVLKEYLKNVYFITGTPCGGKTTISRALAKKYDLALYGVDEEFSRHQSLSDPAYQPAMNRRFSSADEFFCRPYLEYAKWLLDNTREQLDFILLDLIRLSERRAVICDLHLTIEEAQRLTERERVVFLIRNPSNVIEEYCNRPDHQDFNRYINSAINPTEAKENCNKTLRYINEEGYLSIKRSDYFWIERTDDSSVEDTVSRVEKFLRLRK